MVDYVWPADLAPHRVMFYLQPHVGGAESPITRTRKVYGLSAPRWIARFTFRGGYDGDPLDGANGFGPRLDALIADLEGGLNRVRLWDWRRSRPLRQQATNASLTVAVNTPAGATTLHVAGFSPYAYAFSVGDYIGGDGRTHMVRGEQCFADGSGVAVVTFKPPLMADLAAGAAVLVEEVSSPFRLTSEDAGQNETDVGEVTSYTLDFVEDLL